MFAGIHQVMVNTVIFSADYNYFRIGKRVVNKFVSFFLINTAACSHGKSVVKAHIFAHNCTVFLCGGVIIHEISAALPAQADRKQSTF